MLPIFMIQSQVFWLRGKPLRNIQPFNGFAPMQDIERLLNKMFPKNSALVLILLHARKLDGRFYLSGGSWSVLWPGSTIPAVFPKTMKCLSVLHKLFAPLLLSALYSSGFSLLVQLLNNYMWLCRCDCGNEIVVLSGNLLKGNTKSCGCIQRNDLIGKRYGKSLVVERLDADEHGDTAYL